MTNINLLPWREKAKAERLRQFYLLLGVGAGIGVIIIGIWFTIISSTISTQNERNGFLSKEIGALDIRLGEVKKLKEKKQNLTDRINVIVALQEERSSTVRFFDQLVDAVPEGIQLTSLSTANYNVTLNGNAESHGRVSNLMDNIDQSKDLRIPTLQVVQQKETNQAGLQQFSVVAEQKHAQAMVVAKAPAKTKRSKK